MANLEKAGENLAHNVKDAVADTATSAQLREKAGDLKNNLSDMTHIARDAAQQKVSELQQVGREQYKEIEDYVSTQPMKSLLIAGGIGFAVGILLRGR